MSDQIESAASLMVRDYLILAFLVSLGGLQIAVSISGIRGLWILPNQLLTRALGILLIASVSPPTSSCHSGSKAHGPPDQ